MCSQCTVWMGSNLSVHQPWNGWTKRGVFRQRNAMWPGEGLNYKHIMQTNGNNVKYAWTGEGRYKSVYTLGLDWCEVQKQSKPISDVRSQVLGQALWVGWGPVGAWRGFWGSGNIWGLDLSSGYSGVSILWTGFTLNHKFKKMIPNM